MLEKSKCKVYKKTRVRFGNKPEQMLQDEKWELVLQEQQVLADGGQHPKVAPNWVIPQFILLLEEELNHEATVKHHHFHKIIASDVVGAIGVA